MRIPQLEFQIKKSYNLKLRSQQKELNTIHLHLDIKSKLKNQLLNLRKLKLKENIPKNKKQRILSKVKGR